MAYQPNYANAGVAGLDTDDILGAVELFAGDTPAPVTISANITSAVATDGLPAFTPVAVAYDGADITLVDGTTVTQANAITLNTIPAGATAGTKVAVYKAGCFNINALNWPSSMATEADKLAGFDQSACQIYVKKPYYA